MKQIEIGKKKLFAQMPTKIKAVSDGIDSKWQTVNTSNAINTQQNEVVKSDDVDKVMNRTK
jgi:hypothetical protein